MILLGGIGFQQMEGATSATFQNFVYTKGMQLYTPQTK